MMNLNKLKKPEEKLSIIRSVTTGFDREAQDIADTCTDIAVKPLIQLTEGAIQKG